MNDLIQIKTEYKCVFHMRIVCVQCSLGRLSCVREKTKHLLQQHSYVYYTYNHPQRTIHWLDFLFLLVTVYKISALYRLLLFAVAVGAVDVGFVAVLVCLFGLSARHNQIFLKKWKWRRECFNMFLVFGALDTFYTYCCLLACCTAKTTPYSLSVFVYL